MASYLVVELRIVGPYIFLFMLVCVYFHILINFPSLLSILLLCVLVGVNRIVLGYPEEKKRIEMK